MAQECDFKAAIVTVNDSETIVVKSRSLADSPDLTFKTIRLSCESHPYRPGRNYGGFILYGLESDGTVLQDWWLNGKHCKSAYLVIQDTGSEEVKRYIGKAPGQVHGAVYWNVFGKGADVEKAIGEGFSLKDNGYEWNSKTFNAKSDLYHDGKRNISNVMKMCVQQIWEDWRRKSAVGMTYSVKELLRWGNVL